MAPASMKAASLNRKAHTESTDEVGSHHSDIQVNGDPANEPERKSRGPVDSPYPAWKGAGVLGDWTGNDARIVLVAHIEIAVGTVADGSVNGHEPSQVQVRR